MLQNPAIIKDPEISDNLKLPHPIYYRNVKQTISWDCSWGLPHAASAVTPVILLNICFSNNYRFESQSCNIYKIPCFFFRTVVKGYCSDVVQQSIIIADYLNSFFIIKRYTKHSTPVISCANRYGSKDDVSGST